MSKNKGVTITQIVKNLAKRSIFFEPSGESFLRILNCDDDFFTCFNENDVELEPRQIQYDSVDLGKDSFYEITKIGIF